MSPFELVGVWARAVATTPVPDVFASPAAFGGHPDIDLSPDSTGPGLGQTLLPDEVLNVAVSAAAFMKRPKFISELIGYPDDFFFIRVCDAEPTTTFRTKLYWN